MTFITTFALNRGDIWDRRDGFVAAFRRFYSVVSRPGCAVVVCELFLFYLRGVSFARVIVSLKLLCLTYQVRSFGQYGGPGVELS